jgi:hypothetical protein
MFVALAVLAAANPLTATASHRRDTAPDKTAVVLSADNGAFNPLLPPPVALAALWPDLSMAQKSPDLAPGNFAPCYAAADWAAYRDQFGAQADDALRKRASQVALFAQSLIDAAAKTNQPGLKRLLLMRATILTYRATGGNSTAQKALAALQDATDINVPMQVAALWTLSDGMARQAATPKVDRPKFSLIAARANIQLCLLLLDADQVAAAQAAAKLLARHDGAIRSDPALRGQAAMIRTLTSQTSAMLDYLHTQYDLLANGDDTGTLPLYIYGRLVKNNPAAASGLASHRNSDVTRQLDALFARAQRDPVANYALAEDLKTIAATLPDEILRHRTLYAALQSYRTFLSSNQTEPERVKRTMARMAIQTVAGDGASPNPAIQPFEKPPILPMPTTVAAATAQG